MAERLPPGFRFEMRLSQPFGSTWRWDYICEGSIGAVQFHVSEPPSKDYDYSGGVELHRATCRAGDGPPSHGRCHALSERACWHDGSSMMGESWIRWWRLDRNDHETVFRALAREYRNRFEPEEPSDG